MISWLQVVDKLYDYGQCRVAHMWSRGAFSAHPGWHDCTFFFRSRLIRCIKCYSYYNNCPGWPKAHQNKGKEVFGITLPPRLHCLQGAGADRNSDWSCLRFAPEEKIPGTSPVSPAIRGLLKFLAHPLPLQNTKWHGHELTTTLRRNVVVSLTAKANKILTLVGEAAVSRESLGPAWGQDHEPKAMENKVCS